MGATVNGEYILGVIDEIAATSSRTEKERILGAAIDAPLMQRVLKATYDPFITYGLTPERITGVGEWDVGDARVWTLLEELATRRYTGNLARHSLTAVMSQATPATAELLWRILSKDMRAGFTAGTVNRVRPGTISVFEVMLSHKYEPKRIKKWPVWVEPKLDGLRTICLVQNGEAKFLSRTGKEFPALDPLKPHVEAWSINMGGNVVIEGEAIAGGFAETSGAVRRKSELATTTEFHVFDILPLEIFTEAAKSAQFSRRRQELETYHAWLPKDSPIRLVPGFQANSHDEIVALYEGFRDTPLATYLARGEETLEARLKTELGHHPLEGAIVKPLDGVYEKRRSFSWLKMKASETEDLIISGFFEGEGRLAGNLGGVIVDRSYKGGIVKVRVGGGFSDADRAEIWANQTRYLGKTIEVEAHEETPDGSLRHPRFVKMRPDKDRDAA